MFVLDNIRRIFDKVEKILNAAKEDLSEDGEGADIEWSFLDFVQPLKQIITEDRILCEAVPYFTSENRFFCGPPGALHKELAMDIADFLKRPFRTIRLGEDSYPTDIDGIANFMKFVIETVEKAGCPNPIIFFEGLEKIKDRKAKRIIAQLGDRRRNRSFLDRLSCFPHDLDSVLFIVSEKREYYELGGNETNLPHYSKTLLFPLGLNTEQKIQATRKSILPRLLTKHKRARLPLSDSVLRSVIEDFTIKNGFKDLETVMDLILSRAQDSGEIPVSLLRNECGRPFRWCRKSSDMFEADGRLAIGCSTLLSLIFLQGGGTKAIVESMRCEFSGEQDTVEDPSLQDLVDICRNFLFCNAEKYCFSDKKKPIKVTFPKGGSGNSSGCSIFLSLFSLFTNRRVRSDSAVSGEVSLSGRILKIGGVYLKALAAYKTGIRRVIFPKGCSSVVEAQMDDLLKREMEFVFVETVDDLIEEMIEK
ncbi:hypothetical protein QR680_008476 [Steinernema hermaphroditum]|uniref:Lon proteolytic domain-containing protein n=1 Tax=Steinernema hermaphroditum TaxID=289476 RepID=A0AA39IGR9_9BILA|nr:hypothetical protein QR680_008476 [Steinernema hermaphroditum]